VLSRQISVNGLVVSLRKLKVCMQQVGKIFMEKVLKIIRYKLYLGTFCCQLQLCTGRFRKKRDSFDYLCLVSQVAPPEAEVHF
jgi:hypothetical protein